MYWLENIDKYLEHHASPAVIQRGKTLSNIGAIRSIEYDTQANKGVVKVSSGEIFEVEIINGVSHDFRDIKTECDCDYQQGLCKHIVAALIGLKKKFQYNSAAIMHIIKSKESNRKSSKEFKLTDDLLTKYSIEAQYPTVVRDEDETTIEPKTISNSLLSFEVGIRIPGRMKPLYKKDVVDFVKGVDNTTTRCTCNKPVQEFCLHQLKALHHIIIELRQASILESFVDTEELKNQAMQDYGLSSIADVENHFTITLGVNGPEFIPNDKELCSFSDHIHFGKKIEKIQNTNIYDIIVTNEVENDSLQGVALYIDEEYDAIPLRIHIVSGKANKKTGKIISAVQSISDPAAVSPLLRSFFLDYEKIKSLYHNRFAETVHPKTLSFLNNHLNTLAQVPVFYMKERFSFRRADMRSVSFCDEPYQVFLKLRKNNSQYVLEAFYKFGDSEVPVKKHNVHYNPILTLYGNEIYIIGDVKQSLLLKFLVEKPRIKYASKSLEMLCEQVANFSKIVNVEIDPKINVGQKKIKPLKKYLRLSESTDHLILQPILVYDDQKEYMPVIDMTHIENVENSLVRIIRDDSYEQSFLSSFEGLSNDFKQQKKFGFFHKHLDNVLNTAWIFELYRFCKEHDITILGYETLTRINYTPFEAKVRINVSSGIDWFESDVSMEFGNQSADLIALRASILADEKFVKLSDGSQGLIPEEWVDRLASLFRNSELKDGKLLISKMKFNLIDSLFDEINDDQLRMEIDYRKRLLLDFKNIDPIPLPKAIKANLRPYQLQGFYWLKFLHDFGFGGCLADDMGLGKTLQVLTMLAYVKENTGGTSLIVLPKSLLFNWEDEIGKFCPSLKYVIYHGPKRKLLLKQFGEYDLVLSTYGTVTNDIEEIMDFHFSYAVLDESQAIKNPASKRYKAMRLIKSDHKIVMTGTPIENHTFDLYAQFNFINPGFFGSTSSFKRSYAEPIDTFGNEVVAMELRNLVKPFLLRRTKEQVAKDLPPKTESTIHVEMLEKQRVIYDAYVEKYREYIGQKISENGIQKSKMYVLEALLKLRQICNSPALLNDGSNHPNESVKIDVLMEQLGEIISRHKVLVISQFTSMLALIRERIESAQIPYEYLDGSTKNRKEVVDNFNNNEDIKVFLLSLKAGGVGLNLASADYVYIVDPWWNPAAEAQAIDRTHRIGQDKHVFAYRLICNNSIEEKIQTLQNKKRKMASDIIKVEESFVKSLTQEDIMALFS